MPGAVCKQIICSCERFMAIARDADIILDDPTSGISEEARATVKAVRTSALAMGKHFGSIAGQMPNDMFAGIESMADAFETFSRKALVAALE